jgi:hypothetical protein
MQANPAQTNSTPLIAFKLTTALKFHPQPSIPLHIAHSEGAFHYSQILHRSISDFCSFSALIICLLRQHHRSNLIAPDSSTIGGTKFDSSLAFPIWCLEPFIYKLFKRFLQLILTTLAYWRLHALCDCILIHQYSRRAGRGTSRLFVHFL